MGGRRPVKVLLTCMDPMEFLEKFKPTPAQRAERDRRTAEAFAMFDAWQHDPAHPEREDMDILKAVEAYGQQAT